MYRFNPASKRLLLTIALLSGSASAWATNHNVAVGGSAGLAFVDSETGTNVTNIRAGDSVTFTNQAPFGFHNTRSDGPVTVFRCANGCDGAGGSGAPSSTGWIATITFPTVGTVNYYCEIHGAPGSGMHGTINVQTLPVELQSFDVD